MCFASPDLGDATLFLVLLQHVCKSRVPQVLLWLRKEAEVSKNASPWELVMMPTKSKNTSDKVKNGYCRIHGLTDRWRNTTRGTGDGFW